MKLATLDRCVGAEGATDDFAQRLGAVDDEQLADLGTSPRSIRLSMSACTTAAFSVAPSIRASGCLWPSASMPRAATSTRSLPMCSPSIWMTRRSSLDRSDIIHSASRSADVATNRREAADFEVPPPAMTGRSPSGSRTARLSLRVDTLISIRSWPTGQASLPPVPLSRSAAQLHGRRNCAPAGDAQQPCHHGSRSFLWSCPSGGRRGLRYDYAARRRVAARPRKAFVHPGRQTEALKGAVHILPSRLEAGHERER